jgi:hypothetical protein
MLEYPGISDRAVIIRASFEFLYVAHALDVKYYFLGVFIELLAVAAHPRLQVIVLGVLFELLARILMIKAPRGLIQNGRVRIVKPVGFHWGQVREVSLQRLLLVPF